LITFDVVSGAPNATWALTGESGSWLLEKIPFSNGTSDRVLINIVRQSGTPKVSDLSNLDLAGVQIGEFAVLTYADARAGRSAVFFDAQPAPNLKILIAGLAPGGWEIWRNGWLDEPKNLVTPEARALYHEGKPGGFFLRHVS
jgi:hypothetical protein